MRWLPHLAVSTRLRLAMAAVAGLFAYIDHSFVTALPWILLVVTLDLAAASLGYLTVIQGAFRHTQLIALLVVGVVSAGIGMGSEGSWSKLLILIPAYHAGSRFSRTGAFSAPLVGLVVALATSWWLDRLTPPESQLITLASLLGRALRAARAPGPASSSRRSVIPDANVAAEASLLLRRLHELADTLDTGFDAPGSAEMALQDLSNQMRSARSAILVGYGDDPAVPLAIRGADRTPWPDPMEQDSVLAWTWRRGEATLTEWKDDLVARSVIVVPLNDDKGDRLGLLVADRPAGHAVPRGGPRRGPGRGRPARGQHRPVGALRRAARARRAGGARAAGPRDARRDRPGDGRARLRHRRRATQGARRRLPHRRRAGRPAGRRVTGPG